MLMLLDLIIDLLMPDALDEKERYEQQLVNDYKQSKQ